MDSSDTKSAAHLNIGHGETRVRVRYAETDQMGVVYHANYLVWFEIGRVELMRQLGFDYKRMESEDDCHIVVVEANCRYKSPARYDDELLIETEIAALRRFVLKFRYRVLRVSDRTLLSEGETTHVITDRNLKKRSLPQNYVDAFRRVRNDLRC
ncbi:MAG TPA: thioesterase family protein [Acidobacteriaceae bacterium]|nr:thioesterase family protein [Acidobacteriaceae bacterium]